MVKEIAAERGGGEFRWAVREEERARLWRARHDAYYASLALRPGAKGWTTDVCVPISALAQCIAETKADNRASSTADRPRRPCRGRKLPPDLHRGSREQEELAEAHRLNERMVRRALALGGTCTGEHGVGIGKLEYLDAEHGPRWTSCAPSSARSIRRT